MFSLFVFHLFVFPKITTHFQTFKISNFKYFGMCLFCFCFSKFQIFKMSNWHVVVFGFQRFKTYEFHKKIEIDCARVLIFLFQNFKLSKTRACFKNIYIYIWRMKNQILKYWKVKIWEFANLKKNNKNWTCWHFEILKTAHLDSRQADGPRGRLGDPGLDFPDRGLVLVGGKQ